METKQSTTAAEFQARLNARAEHQGEPAGYAIERYRDHSNGYADYVGFVVTGPDVARAQAWLVAALAAENAGKPRTSGDTTLLAEVRTVRVSSLVNGRDVWREVTYVAAARYSLGE